MASRAMPSRVHSHRHPESASPLNGQCLVGLFNLAAAYLLVCRVGDFNLRNTRQVLVLGAGMLVMSLMLAHTFGRLHGGL
jgi:hypothetical protein